MEIPADLRYEEIVRTLNLKRAERLRFLGLLASSAIFANEKNPAGWGISFRPTNSRALVRLNVGRCRALDVWPDGRVGLEVDGRAITNQDQRALKALGAEVHEQDLSVKELLYVRLALSKFRAASQRLEPAHRAFIERALDARRGRSLWWKSHSPELVWYVREVTRAELPQPSYVHTRLSEVGSSPEAVVIDSRIEKHRTESSIAGPRDEYVFLRREGRLLKEYATYINSRGARVAPKRFRIKGEKGDIRCDFYNESREQLVEAKGSNLRGAIRMAIGELADYRRHFRSGVKCAVLLPERPSSDIEALLSSQNVSVIWREGRGGFKDNVGGRFCQA